MYINAKISPLKCLINNPSSVFLNIARELYSDDQVGRYLHKLLHITNYIGQVLLKYLPQLQLGAIQRAIFLLKIIQFIFSIIVHFIFSVDMFEVHGLCTSVCNFLMRNN